MATKKENTKGKIKPLLDRVLLREEEAKTSKTQSGIYIPEGAEKDKGTKRGVVLAVGEGKYENGKLIPVRVKIGDEVLYAWGDQIEVDGEKYVIVRESEISAVVKS
jgi:chaperonin GroES